MSAYPATEKEQRVPYGALHSLVAAIFTSSGMSERDAGLLARTLAHADLRGVHSHGVLRVPEYVKKLEGKVNPKGRPRIVKDSAAALVIDGDNSMGQIGSHFAMEKAIERAQTTNVAIATVRGSNHCGAMAYYAMQALPHGMIGWAATNALPTMAPWGGIDKIIGINPLAVAIPAGEEADIVLDAAFSGSSHGKIRVYQQKGLSIPPSWAFDGEGKPTTDAGEAIEGLLQPIGGYKGVGLAVVTGVLSSLLSGASYGDELGNMIDGPKAGHDGHFFLAINIAAFEDPDTFKALIDSLIRQIQASRRMEGVEQLYAPGGLEAETEKNYRKQGIPLNSETIDGLRRVAAELKVGEGNDLEVVKP